MILSDLLGVLFPVYCVGCGAWDVVLCAQCRRVVMGQDGLVQAGGGQVCAAPWRVLSVAEGRGGDGGGGGVRRVEVAHWALAEYAGVARHFLLAAKHRRDVKLESELLEAGRELGRRLGASAVTRGWGGRGIRVVPAPSRVRRRLVGREVALPLAVGVAYELAAVLGAEVQMSESFRLRWGAGTQAGKSGVQRRHSRVGTIECVRPAVEGEVVVFVDDIVTTGATIREMARAMGRVPDAVVSLCWVSG